MITPINLTAVEQMTEAVFRRTLAAKFNELAQAVNTGIVHENKVSADRAVDQVYADLPLPVVAAMVQEKADKLKQQYGL